MSKIDFSKLVAIKNIKGENDQETKELKELYSMAKSYINSFDWSSNIRESYLGIGIPGIIGVFLFRIEPTKPEADEFIWVIVGDLPPAYLVTDDCLNPVSALGGYIWEMNKWVKAAKEGKSVEDLIPVNVPVNSENAKRLEKRLKFLKKNILPL